VLNTDGVITASEHTTKTYAMPLSSVWLFGFNVRNIEVTDDGDGHACDEFQIKKYGQLVTTPSDTTVNSSHDFAV